MAGKNWDEIATAEFEALESAWQEEWSDLRGRVSKQR